MLLCYIEPMSTIREYLRNIRTSTSILGKWSLAISFDNRVEQRAPLFCYKKISKSTSYRAVIS